MNSKAYLKSFTSNVQSFVTGLLRNLKQDKEGAHLI